MQKEIKKKGVMNGVGMIELCNKELRIKMHANLVDTTMDAIN